MRAKSFDRLTEFGKISSQRGWERNILGVQSLGCTYYSWLRHLVYRLDVLMSDDVTFTDM